MTLLARFPAVSGAIPSSLRGADTAYYRHNGRWISLQMSLFCPCWCYGATFGTCHSAKVTFPSSMDGGLCHVAGFVDVALPPDGIAEWHWGHVLYYCLSFCNIKKMYFETFNNSLVLGNAAVLSAPVVLKLEYPGITVSTPWLLMYWCR